MQKTIYAIYKDEKFLFEGTAKECAKYMEVKEETIRFWNSPAYKRRISGLTKKLKRKRNCTLAIIIEED